MLVLMLMYLNYIYIYNHYYNNNKWNIIYVWQMYYIIIVKCIFFLHFDYTIIKKLIREWLSRLWSPWIVYRIRPAWYSIRVAIN